MTAQRGMLSQKPQKASIEEKSVTIILCQGSDTSIYRTSGKPKNLAVIILLYCNRISTTHFVCIVTYVSKLYEHSVEMLKSVFARTGFKEATS